MHTEHKTFDSNSFDDITSVVVGRLEAGRHLLHDAPPTVCEAMNAILDDATAKLEHLLELSTGFDWPEERRNGTEAPEAELKIAKPPVDRERLRRGVSLLSVLLEKIEWDDHSGLTECDTLETAIKELRAAGGLED